MIGNEGGVECEVQIADSAEGTRIWFLRLKVVSTTISLVLRLTASFVVAAYEGWVKRKYEIVKRVKDRVKIQFVSLIPTNFITSLTEVVVYRGKIETVFHVLSVVNLRPRIKWPQRKEPSSQPLNLCLTEPEKSVTCEVLYSPDTDEIRADVIFIHGLHGSIVHTWKQGLWSYRKEVRNSPLEHKYKLSRADEDAKRNVCDINGGTGAQVAGRRNRNLTISGEDHDLVLENITDIINNIDDRIKETTNGNVAAMEEKVEPYTQCWPRDWLPKDCPGIRVIAVNYTTDPFLWRPVWITKRIRTSMTERSEEMEGHLLKLGVGQNPIVWVGHSKGGLFVKQMLVDASNTDDPALQRFIHQTKAIMFYSVPHRGSSLAHINLPLLRQSIELTEVKRDCEQVLKLHNQFMKLYESNNLTAEVYSFVETVLTFMFITNVRVVSVDSADIGFGVFRGVNIDHREICKPLNRDCFLYTELANLINRVV